MKKLTRFLVAIASLLCTSAAFSVNTVNINGVDHAIDTIIPKHTIGPGTSYAFYHLPNRPLTIHVLEVDLNNQYVQLEACNGGQKSVATELTTNMYKRNDSPGHDMIAAHNGSFFHTSETDGTAVGMSRMGLICNGEILQNPVGWPLFVLTQDKVSYLENVHFSANITTSTGSNRIHTLNTHLLELESVDDAGERMMMFTREYGTKTNTASGGTKVILVPKEGDFTITPNMTIACTVESIFDNTGASDIPEGKAVLYGTGVNETFLKGLTVGEECTINIATTVPSVPSINNIKEGLGGSSHFILRDGEVVISGNPDIHPRTFMGISKDGKTVYSVAVDGRWEGSAGVTLDDEGRILKMLGAWHGLNLDGGGSTTMVVHGDIKNHVSGGAERAVGDALLVYSSAPVDDDIAKIAFEPRAYNVPITARFRPAIYAYNQYDLIKNKDLEGVKLSCDSEIGSFNENNEFIATGDVASGYIYAEYNGITTKQLVNTIMSPLALEYDSYVVDDKAEYPILMNGTVGNFVYKADAASVTWTIDDESLCSISDGKVRGIKNGVATLTGTSSNFNGNVTINVEIPDTQTKSIFPTFDASTWSFTQTGGTDQSVTADGEGVKISYIGNGVSRGATFSIFNNTIKSFGLPNAIKMNINPGNATVKKVQLSFRNNKNISATVDLTTTQLTKNADNEFVINVPNNWADDNTNFPIYINGILLGMGASAKNTQFDITISKLEQIYGDPSGIDDVIDNGNAISIYPNPVISGSPVSINIEGEAQVSIYTLGGSLVNSIKLSGNELLETAGMSAGMYILHIVGETNIYTTKLIIK